MTLYFTLLIAVSFLPKNEFSSKEILFTAHITYDEIESFKSYDNFFFLNKLPLISCLYKCIFSERCSIVFYDEYHSCFLIRMKNSSTSIRNDYILYLKKSNLINYFKYLVILKINRQILNF